MERRVCTARMCTRWVRSFVTAHVVIVAVVREVGSSVWSCSVRPTAEIRCNCPIDAARFAKVSVLRCWIIVIFRRRSVSVWWGFNQNRFHARFTTKTSRRSNIPCLRRRFRSSHSARGIPCRRMRRGVDRRLSVFGCSECKLNFVL